MEVIAAARDSVSVPRFLSQGKFQILVNVFLILPDHCGQELFNLSGLRADRSPSLFMLCL